MSEHNFLKDIKIIKETLSVKGEPDIEVELLYTHHGPITYFNKKVLKFYEKQDKSLFAWDTWRRFLHMFSHVVYKIEHFYFSIALIIK